VISWQVRDAAQAVFVVEDYRAFVDIQADLQERLDVAGVAVFDTRLRRLAYAPALSSLNERDLVDLDEERKAADDALERWAADDLRRVNARIEFRLRESLRWAGRLPAPSAGEDGPGQ
jgi:hypothetical protein